MTREITMKKQELDKKPNKNLTFKTIHHVDSDDDDEMEEDIKKNHHHKQAMKATWSDDSDSSSSDNEEHVANICFMAIESDNNVLFWMMRV
ncbi:hypothetical protein NC652_027827 [Populus alba x Populus x berolinensis]|nr:hypothetical protein NC652_027827 [Populus alba x Populus x berolinensis]